MVGPVRLLTAALLLVALPYTVAGGEDGGQGWLGGIAKTNSNGRTDATADGEHLDLHGSRSHTSNSRGSGNDEATATEAPKFACKTTTECSKELAAYYGYLPIVWRDPDFGDPRPFQPPAADPAKPAAAPQIVTADDVARFLPAQGALHSEPRGWAVVNVPANFWVEVEPATVDGELFDTPVQVRFTPTQYLWNYGDGGVAQTDAPGASWKSLGQEELTATPTGHVYQRRGSVAASVRIVYTAQYRVDGGEWVAVQGVVVAAAPPARLVVATESTVLTAAG